MRKIRVPGSERFFSWIWNALRYVVVVVIVAISILSRVPRFG